MSKISLERAFVEVINAAKGKESNLAFANRAFPELAMRSRVTMWGRLLNPDKATGKCRSLSIDEAERLAAAVGLRFEDVLWRARTYQAMGTIPPEENA